MAKKIKIEKTSNKKSTVHGVQVTIGGILFVPAGKKTWPTRTHRDRAVEKVVQAVIGAKPLDLVTKDLNPPAPLKPLGKSKPAAKKAAAPAPKAVGTKSGRVSAAKPNKANKPKRLTKAQVAANPDQPSIDAANSVDIDALDTDDEAVPSPATDAAADAADAAAADDDTPDGAAQAIAEEQGEPEGEPLDDLSGPNDDASKMPDEA